MKKGLKAIATITLGCFLTTQSVWGAPGAGIEMVGKPELPAYLSIDVPMELGTVDALYEAPNSANPQFILHIQNAHANYQAQIKIKQLLGYMNKKYGFKTIFVEGASEKLDPDYLRLFPDQERNLKLCDELAKQGELTGAELFLMEASSDPRSTNHDPRSAIEENRGPWPVSRVPVEALGIEEASLYKANYDALKKVFGAETDITRFFKGFDAKLDGAASKTFTPETRELIADWKRFEQGRRQFMPFVQSLAKKSKKILKVDLESLFAQVGWPQITRLLVIQQMENEMNKAKGVEEQAALIKMLREKGLSKELLATLENFSEGSIAVGKSTREVSPREVLERLAAEAGPKGFKFSDYPAFSLYAGYVTLRSELDSKVLFEEIEYLFAQMLDALAKEPEQQTLLALYRDGELLRKLLHLELNRAQWRQVVEAKDRIAIPSLVARLKAVVQASDQSSQVARRSSLVASKAGDQRPATRDQQVMPKAFGAKMDELFSAGLEFYDFAHKREGVFYKEMQTAMTERKITKAILITGGFHTDGMSDLFRDNAVSYGIVTPRLSEKSDESLYRTVMLQNREHPFSVSYIEQAIKAAGITNQPDPAATVALILDRTADVAQVGLPEAVNILNGSRFAARNELRLDPSASVDGKPAYKLVRRNEAPLGVTKTTAGPVSIEFGSIADLAKASTPQVIPVTFGPAEPDRNVPVVQSVFAKETPVGPIATYFSHLLAPATAAVKPAVVGTRSWFGRILPLLAALIVAVSSAWGQEKIIRSIEPMGNNKYVLDLNFPAGTWNLMYATSLNSTNFINLGTVTGPATGFYIHDGSTNKTGFLKPQLVANSGAAAKAVTEKPVEMPKPLALTPVKPTRSEMRDLMGSLAQRVRLAVLVGVLGLAAMPGLGQEKIIRSIEPMGNNKYVLDLNFPAGTWNLMYATSLNSTNFINLGTVTGPATGFYIHDGSTNKTGFFKPQLVVNPALRATTTTGKPAEMPKPLELVPAKPRSEVRTIPSVLSLENLEKEVMGVRGALIGTPSNVHIALSQDTTKVEVRVSDNTIPVLVLDATQVIGLAVVGEDVYVGHLRTDNGQPQIVLLPPNLDLTKWTLGTNQAPAENIVDLTKLPPGLEGWRWVQNILFAASTTPPPAGKRSEVRAGKEFLDMTRFNVGQRIPILRAEKEKLAEQIKAGNWMAIGKWLGTAWDLSVARRDYDRLMKQQPSALPPEFTIQRTSATPEPILMGSRGTTVVGGFRITIGKIGEGIVPVRIERIEPAGVLVNETYRVGAAILDHPEIPWQIRIADSAPNIRLEFIARSEVRGLVDEAIGSVLRTGAERLIAANPAAGRMTIQDAERLFQADYHKYAAFKIISAIGYMQLLEALRGENVNGKLDARIAEMQGLIKTLQKGKNGTLTADDIIIAPAETPGKINYPAAFLDVREMQFIAGKNPAEDRILVTEGTGERSIVTRVIDERGAVHAQFVSRSEVRGINQAIVQSRQSLVSSLKPLFNTTILFGLLGLASLAVPATSSAQTPPVVSIVRNGLAQATVKVANPYSPGAHDLQGAGQVNGPWNTLATNYFVLPGQEANFVRNTGANTQEFFRATKRTATYLPLVTPWTFANGATVTNTLNSENFMTVNYSGTNTASFGGSVFNYAANPLNLETNFPGGMRFFFASPNIPSVKLEIKDGANVWAGIASLSSTGRGYGLPLNNITGIDKTHVVEINLVIEGQGQKVLYVDWGLFNYVTPIPPGDQGVSVTALPLHNLGSFADSTNTTATVTTTSTNTFILDYTGPATASFGGAFSMFTNDFNLPVDFSTGITFSLASTNATTLDVELKDANDKGWRGAATGITATPQKYTVNLSTVWGIDKTRVRQFIFTSAGAGHKTYDITMGNYNWITPIPPGNQADVITALPKHALGSFADSTNTVADVASTSTNTFTLHYVGPDVASFGGAVSGFTNDFNLPVYFPQGITFSISSTNISTADFGIQDADGNRWRGNITGITSTPTKHTVGLSMVTGINQARVRKFIFTASGKVDADIDVLWGNYVWFPPLGLSSQKGTPRSEVRTLTPAGQVKGIQTEASRLQTSATAVVLPEGVRAEAMQAAKTIKTPAFPNLPVFLPASRITEPILPSFLRSETRMNAVRKELGPRSLLVEKARWGFDVEMITKLESEGQAGKVSVLIAAIAGKFIRQEAMPKEQVAELVALALATEATVAEFVAKVKEILNIQDTAGLMAELYAAGEGVDANDLMSYRAVLTNAYQRVTLFWISAPGDVKANEARAAEIVKDEVAWARKQGLDFEGRFQIIVTTAAKLPEAIATAATDAKKDFVKITNVKGIDAAAPMVLAGTPDLLGQLKADTVSAKLIERDAYQKKPALRGAAHLAMSILSQVALVNADLLDNRTAQILNPRANGRYSLNEAGLQALVTALTNAIQAIQAMARAA